MAPQESLKEITTVEVAKHNKEDDCWLIIGNENNGGPKVYDVTSYLDDHPGGAEVIMDVAGQDADEFFEDIGHSDDAREELKKHLIGTLKLDPEEIARRKAEAEAAAAKSAGGGGAGLFVVLAGVALAGAYYMKMQNGAESS
mmetsp:Transcript_7087/g.9595  ORF Transcript_7087/g.9595 Transcript_7087/m.9595 type:complete len:142 (-) Transcript_7087:313-738(-)|eukprot:CAMPEP_0185725332 /NCGR_PEP_ID=MMETSP1171-20130828/1618_1 /TAXON_ID=374046 /ORGANISM="Helicotheca tamensis, Strain CCMP826" /LENGTH=141 /DNA_ID=CAMNT_0028393437 /DNA_START=138 /DNA_END=563 /DNA_ORIENTATION=-